MLKRKLYRDILKNKAQFLTIFLMLFLGIAIFSGIQSEWYGLDQESKKYYEEANMADAWIYKNNIVDEDIKHLEDLKGIQEVEARTLLPINLEDERQLDLIIQDDMNISKFKLMKGIKYDKTKKGIWLDHLFAKENNYQIKDTFNLSLEGKDIELEVLGMIQHPEYVYTTTSGEMIPDHKQKGFGVISMKSLPIDIDANQLLVKSTLQSEDLTANIKQVLQDTGLIVIDRLSHPSVAMLESEIKQHQAFGGIFPILFLLIALFTSITTISKMIMNQKSQIHILSALGFSKRKIILHYTSFIAYITLFAGIGGCVIGPLLIPPLIYKMLKVMFVLPSLNASLSIYNMMIVLSGLIICVIIAFITCIKAINKDETKIKIHKLKHQSKLKSFYIIWNIRDVMRNKMRSMITVLGIAGCMGLVFCAFTLYDTMNYLNELTYEELQVYDHKVILKESYDSSILSTYKNEYQGEFIQEGSVMLKYEGDEKMGSLSIQESGNLQRILMDNDFVDLDKDGIYCTRKIAEYFDVGIGDQLIWYELGSDKEYKSIIKGIITQPLSQGIVLSSQYYESIEGKFHPNAFISNENIKDLDHIERIQTKENMMKGLDTMLESMYMMIAVLILGACVLGIVVIYNLGVLSYYEHLHELATLKVLGFKRKQLKRLLYTQQFNLTLIGIFVGIPIGSILSYVTFSTIGDTMDIIVYVEPITILLCSLSTLILSMNVSMMMLRKVKNINMVEAMKEVD